MCSHGDRGEVVLYDFGLSFLIDEVVTPGQDQPILVGVVLERSDVHQPTDHGVTTLGSRVDPFDKLAIAGGFEDQFLPDLRNGLKVGVGLFGGDIGVVG
jgi:hypothetical protein